MLDEQVHWKSFAGVVCGDVILSKDDYQKGVATASSVFKQLGVARDETVGFCMRNDLKMLQGVLGAMFIGSRPVPINWHLSPSEIEWIVGDARCKYVVMHTDLWHQFKERLPANVQPILVRPSDDLIRAFKLTDEHLVQPEGVMCWESLNEQEGPLQDPPIRQSSAVMYTSGTTGNPKAVRWRTMTEEEYEFNVQARGKLYGVNGDHRCLIPGPLYHSAPFTASLQGSTRSPMAVIMPKFDPEAFLAAIEKYAITSALMAPILYHRLLALPESVRNRYDTSSLRYVLHTAAPCSAEIKQRMIDWFGPVINEVYGATETGLVTFCTSQDALKKPGTAGKIIPNKVVKILNENGEELPIGETGLIYASKPAIDFTYQSHPEARKEMELEGLVTVGDMGYVDEDGYLYVVDRAKDMVISGGVNIYPREIENALLSHDGVYDCAVFGVPDDEFGESIMAHVQPKSGQSLTADELKGFLATRIGRFKIPREIRVVHDLPREDSGKIFKRKIRDQYWQAAGRQI